MRSIATTMAWEFWRRSRGDLPLVLIGAICLPALMYGALSTRIDLKGLGTQTAASINFAFLIVVGLAFTGHILQAQGPPARFYARPIATWRLVACQLLVSMGVISVLYLMAAATLQVAFHVAWPLWGPALFFAAVVAAMYAAVWSTSQSKLLQLVAGSLVAVAAFFWLKWRFGGPGFEPARQTWVDVAAGDLLTLLIAAGAAYAVAVAGISRDRCGEHRLWPAVIHRFERVLAGRGARRKPFASLRAAQFWSIWRRAGVQGVVVVLNVHLVVLVILLCSERHWSRTGDFLGSFVLLTLWLLQLIALIFTAGAGECVKVPGRLEWDMSPFLATRPIRSTDLAASFLKAGTASILSCAAVNTLMLLLVAGLFAVWGDAQEVGQFLRRPLDHYIAQFMPARGFDLWQLPMLVAGAVLVAWTVAGLALSIFVAGRTWIFTTCSLGGSALGIGVMLIMVFCPANLIPAIKAGSSWVVGMTCLMGTGAACAAACWRSLVTARLVWWMLAGWIALCGVSCLLWLSFFALPALPYRVLACGLLALPFAPLATAPLAVAWNRHR